jgi:hypothetical protein
MSEEYGNGGDGAGLWARARPGWRASEVADEAPNPLMLAAYLDDNLEEAGREAVETWMASVPEALDLMISARADLGQTSGPAPKDLISRAQGLVQAPVKESAGFGVWLRGLIGFEPAAWRPLAWAGMTVALLVMVSAGGFELGRLGTERLVSTQSAALGDDLEFGLDDPADDFL